MCNGRTLLIKQPHRKGQFLPNLPYEIKTGVFCTSYLDFKKTIMYRIMNEENNLETNETIEGNETGLAGMNHKESISDAIDWQNDLDLLKDLDCVEKNELTLGNQAPYKMDNRSILKQKYPIGATTGLQNRLGKTSSHRKLINSIEEVTAELQTSSKISNQIEISPDQKKIKRLDFFEGKNLSKNAASETILNQATVSEMEEGSLNLNTRNHQLKIKATPSTANAVHNIPSINLDMFNLRKPSDITLKTIDNNNEHEEAKDTFPKSRTNLTSARNGIYALRSSLRDESRMKTQIDIDMINHITQEVKQEQRNKEIEQQQRDKKIIQNLSLGKNLAFALKSGGEESQPESSARKRPGTSAEINYFEKTTLRDTSIMNNLRGSVKSHQMSEKQKRSGSSHLQQYEDLYVRNSVGCDPQSTYMYKKINNLRMNNNGVDQDPYRVSGEQWKVRGSGEREVKNDPRDFTFKDRKQALSTADLAKNDSFNNDSLKIIMKSDSRGMLILSESGESSPDLSRIVWEKIVQFFFQLDSRFPDLELSKESVIDFDQFAKQLIRFISQLQGKVKDSLEIANRFEQEKNELKKRVDELDNLINLTLKKAEQRETFLRSKSPEHNPSSDLINRVQKMNGAKVAANLIKRSPLYYKSSTGSSKQESDLNLRLEKLFAKKEIGSPTKVSNSTDMKYYIEYKTTDALNTSPLLKNHSSPDTHHQMIPNNERAPLSQTKKQPLLDTFSGAQGPSNTRYKRIKEIIYQNNQL